MNNREGRSSEERIRELEERVVELERRLGVHREVDEWRAAVPPEMPVAQPVVELTPEDFAMPAVKVIPAHLGHGLGQAVAPAARPVPPPLPARAGKSLEQVIGQNVALWIGAGVLLLGVLFFLQYAWNEGWINPSPATRYWLAMGFGAALLLTGEWQSRRGLKPFAAVMGGLGVAVMMSACYAAASEWGGLVLTPVRSIAGVAIAGAIAVTQSLRQRTVVPLLTAQIGALVAPMVLGSVFFVPPVLAGLVLSIAVIAALVVALREPTWVATLYVATIGGALHLLAMAWGADSGLLAGTASIVLSAIVLAALLRIERFDDRRDAACWPFPEWLLLGVIAIAATSLTICLARLSVGEGVAMSSIVAISCGVLALCRGQWASLFGVAIAGAWAYAWLRLPADQVAFVPTICIGFTLFAAFSTAIERLSRRVEPSLTPVLLFLSTAPGWARLAVGSRDVASSLGSFGANDPTLAALTAGFAVVLVICALLAWKREAFRLTALALAATLATLVPVLLLDRFALSLAWLAMAAMAGVTCLLTRRRLLLVAGVVLWLLCIGRFVVVDRFDPALSAVLATLGATTIDGWTVYGVVLGIAGMALAWLSASWPRQELTAGNAESGLSYFVPRRAVDGADVGAVLLSIAATLVSAGALTVGLRVLGAPWTVALLAWAGVLLAASLLERRAGWYALGVIVLTLVMLKWMAIDAVLPALAHFTDTHGRSVATPVFNAPSLAGLGGLALAIAAFRLDKGRDRRALGWGAALVVLAMAWLSVEALRGVDFAASHTTIEKPAIVKHATLSVLWALAGLVGVIAGFAMKHAGLRYAALAVLAGTLLKIVVIDMAEVQAVWRVLTFMCVGVLLIGVSFLYQRQAKREQSEPAAPSA